MKTNTVGFKSLSKQFHEINKEWILQLAERAERKNRQVTYCLYYKGKAQNTSAWREQLESIIDYDVEHLGSNREDWIIKEVK